MRADTLGWPTETAEDIELATNEAVSNVVDHACPPDAPGTATLHAWTSTDPETHERCTAELHIQRSAAGTTVIMISAAVAPALPAPE